MGNKRTTPIGGLRTTPDTGRITPPDTIPKNAPRDTQPIAIPATVRDTTITQPPPSADSDDDFELPIIVEEDPTHTIYTQFMDMVYSGEPSTDPILAELFHRWKTGEITAEDSPEVIKTLYDATQKELEKKHTEPPRTQAREASPSPTILQPFDYHIALAEIPDTAETAPDIKAEYIVPGVFEIAATTSQGGEGSKIRHNEDAIYTTRTGDSTIIAAVIDGAGGSGSKTKSSITHPGYVASEIAIGSLTDLTRQYTSLKDIIREVSEHIANHEAWKNETDPNKRGYACGAMARITETGDIELAGAGDTRAFLFSHTGEKKAATQMQNIATYYAQGNTEAALTDTAHLSQITRGLGISLPAGALPPEYTDISYIQTTCNTGDIILLCSDGVGDVVTETELSQLVAQHASDTKALRDAIMQLALQRNNLPANTPFEVQIADGTLQKMTKRGRGDNITVQVIRVIKPNVSEGVRQIRKIIQETAEETPPIQTPEKPTEPAVFATADTIPWTTTERSTPEDRPPQQILRPNPTPTPKPSKLKQAAKWLGGMAAAGLAAFGLHIASDRGGAEKIAPSSETTDTSRSTELSTTRNEMVFDVSEVEPFDRQTNEMVFDVSEVEPFDRQTTEPPTLAVQRTLDTTIDKPVPSDTLTQNISTILTQTLGPTTAARTMDTLRGSLGVYSDAIQREHWTDAIAARDTILAEIRQQEPQQPTIEPTQPQPERERAPLEITLDTQTIGHGPNQHSTVWEALAAVGEMPLRRADGETPYWKNQTEFRRWRMEQLASMSNPRLVHEGDRVDVYVDANDNLHARLIRTQTPQRASQSTSPQRTAQAQRGVVEQSTVTRNTVLGTDPTPSLLPIEVPSVDMSQYVPNPQDMRTPPRTVPVPEPGKPRAQRINNSTNWRQVTPINRPDLAPNLTVPTDADIDDAFEHIRGDRDLRPKSPEPSIQSIEKQTDSKNSITIGSQTIQKGGTVEVVSKTGNVIRYRVLDIITGDGSPDRITLQSTDGRNIRTFKDLRTLRNKPDSFRVIKP